LQDDERRLRTAFEKHYRVQELVNLWGFCHSTVTHLFANEPGVIRLSSGTGRRKYVTLSIPESVVLRVHQRVCQDALQSHLAVGNPRRVIKFRDSHRGVAQKPGNILKLNATKKGAHRERIAETVRPAVVDAAA
jgi:hypothetical protein